MIYLAPILAVVALLFAAYKTAFVSKADAGTERMREISASINEGARAFLFAEYRLLNIPDLIASQNDQVCPGKILRDPESFLRLPEELVFALSKFQMSPIDGRDQLFLFRHRHPGKIEGLHIVRGSRRDVCDIMSLTGQPAFEAVSLQ